MNILNLPLIFCLKVKRGMFGVVLKAAREQTKDAKMIAALGCELDGCEKDGCARPGDCRFQRFIDREDAIAREIMDISYRVLRLQGRLP